MDQVFPKYARFKLADYIVPINKNYLLIEYTECPRDCCTGPEEKKIFIEWNIYPVRERCTCNKSDLQIIVNCQQLYKDIKKNLMGITIVSAIFPLLVFVSLQHTNCKI